MKIKVKNRARAFVSIIVVCLLIFSVVALVIWKGTDKDKLNTAPDNSSSEEKLNPESGEDTKDNSNPSNDTGSGDSSENKADDLSNDSNDQEKDNDNGSMNPNVRLTEEELAKYKPNEAGKVMVVMFHNFIETYKSGDKEYTTTFNEFRNLLQELYDRGYRLISLSDYINNNISVEPGCVPMVFTFDDGTSGQFNLVEENGKLVANKQSAVGIMEEFNKTHPDFGLKGTFFVNLGLKTFDGEGTLDERLKYLIDKGFEIGNHTLEHVKLSEITSAEKIQQQIGGNQKKMSELVPGYIMDTFSLPYGLPSENLVGYVIEGEFEGIKYKNRAIMEVGWDPNPSPVSKKFNPLSIHRVRASGIVPVQADLAWWLSSLKRENEYVSDGNPNTVTVPKEKEEEIDHDKLGGKELIVY